MIDLMKMLPMVVGRVKRVSMRGRGVSTTSDAVDNQSFMGTMSILSALPIGSVLASG